MAATIKDVAKNAQVSVATVSLVIHDNNRITPDTRRKVLKAIKELNYHPTRSARGLVSKTSGNIGFIVTDDHFSRSEPFYTQIFLGTEFKAREEEYYILLTTIPSNFKEDDPMPRFVLEKNIDGIILAGKIANCMIDRLSEMKVPMVLVDYYPPQGNYPVVVIDNIDGGFKATQHLINCHHKNIAFIGGDIEHPSIRDRFQGYKMALEQSNIPFKDSYTVMDAPYPSRKYGHLSAEKLFRQSNDLTAIFTCNDAMALGVLEYLKMKKLKVPEQISLIGFDDVEANLSLDPPLTTMRVPKVDMGVEAMRLMVEILKDKNLSPRKILIPVELIVRKSTCPLH